jgi:hypothetical protein
LSRQLAALAPKIAARLWPKLRALTKLAKQDTQGLLAALQAEYHATVDDRTGGQVLLGPVLTAIMRGLDHLAGAGELVADALHGHSLNTIVLYPGDEVTAGCYAGGMADYEQDEARLYIGATRALETPTGPLTLGAGNVGTDFQTVLRHELGGHLVMQAFEIAVGQKFRITYDERPAAFWAKRVSQYAATDDHELFAEAFAAWTHPDYGRDGATLPTILEALFTKVSIASGTMAKLAKARRQPVDVTLPDGTTVTAASINELLDVVDGEDWAAIEGTVSPAMQQAFEDAGYAEIAAAGVATTDETLFELVDKGAEKYAEEHSAELITQLQSSTRDLIRGTIEDAITEGWSRPELELELQNNYGFSEMRANTIAHQELAMAHSYGRVDVATEAGATKKVWLLSDDHDENEDCDCSAAADAGEVPMEDSFTDDADYDFPPGHVNCLCDWSAIYGGDSDDDLEDEDTEDDDDATKMAKGDDQPRDDHGRFEGNGNFSDSEKAMALGRLASLSNVPTEDRHFADGSKPEVHVNEIGFKGPNKGFGGLHDPKDKPGKYREIDVPLNNVGRAQSTVTREGVENTINRGGSHTDGHTVPTAVKGQDGRYYPSNHHLVAAHMLTGRTSMRMLVTEQTGGGKSYKAPTATKMAKSQWVDAPTEYVRSELTPEDAAADDKLLSLAQQAQDAVDPKDPTGLRVSGRALQATMEAITNLEGPQSRANDHNRAFELHSVAVKHHKDDGGSKTAAKLHTVAATGHQTVATRLYGQVEKRGIDADAHAAATSPSIEGDPSDEQKRAGNYKMGHLRVGGIAISIENPVGSRRRPGWTTLKAHYGYIRLTTGADGDHLDCFVRPGTDDQWDGPVYVIDQYQQDGKTFDEHKIMIGFRSQQAAVKAYLGSYQAGWQLGPVTRLPWKVFKEWVDERTQTKPISSQGDRDGTFA